MFNLVGLTGMIGSGKSTVMSYYQELGIEVIDTDQIAHELTSFGGRAIPAIIDYFGVEYLACDKSLNKGVMRQLIFNNEESRKQLEAIMHPLIYEEICTRVAQRISNYTVIAVPLLLRTNIYIKLFSRIIVVDAPLDMVIQRVMLRNNFSECEVRSILYQQPCRELQLFIANDIIINNGDLSKVKMQVVELDQKYQDIFI